MTDTKQVLLVGGSEADAARIGTVTDTPAGVVVCVELVTVRDGRITEVELVLDRVAFAPVQATLKERAPHH